MFTWLDTILLDLAQKFCDGMQRVTGLTKFRFEKWSLIAAAMYMWHYSLLHFGDWTHLFALCLSTLSVFFVVDIVDEYEAQFLRSGELLFRPWFGRGSRIAIFFLSIFFGLLFANNGAWDLVCEFTCLLLWVYFGACIPRPPSKSKMREYYEKGLEWLRGAVGPVPTPTPVRHR